MRQIYQDRYSHYHNQADGLTGGKYVKTDQILHIKFVQLIAHKLCLNKASKNGSSSKNLNVPLFLENRIGNPVLTVPSVQVHHQEVLEVSTHHVTGNDCGTLSKVSEHTVWPFHALAAATLTYQQPWTSVDHMATQDEPNGLSPPGPASLLGYKGGVVETAQRYPAWTASEAA